MKRKNLIWTIIILVALGVALTIFFINRAGKELTVNSRPVGEGTVEVTVMATGYVQPVDKVEVGTQVSGVIERIFVDFNSQVRKGQRLAELDKSTLNESVSRANATLTRAMSDLTYAQQNFDRTRQLYESKAATQVAYEQAVNSLAQAETSLVDAKANLHQSQVNLSYADILSPIDGIVLDRAVEEGQTVAASFNTPTLFTIANDLTKMQVEADVDEADIGRVKLGQKVIFTVDAYSDDEFNGVVTQIRLQPVVTNNVVTYTVIIEAPNPDERLFPGMTANVTIITQSQSGLLVPVEALNFTPDEDVARELFADVAAAGGPGAPSSGRPSDPPMGMPGGMPNGATPRTASGNGVRGSRNGNNGRPQGVWVLTDGRAIFRPVTTGMNDGVSAVVTSGLNAGDEIILSASYGKVSRKNPGDAVANPLMPQRRR